MVKTMLDAVDQANNGQQNGVELKEKKKKKKHKNKDKDILSTENEKADGNLKNMAKDTECTENKESSHSKKKKKKKSKQDNEHNVNETTDSSHSYDSAQTNGTSVMDENEISVKKKKSKKRKKQKLEQEMDDSERCAQEADGQEKIDDKKKQNKKHRLQDEQTILTCETVDRVGDEVDLNLLNTVEGEVSSNKHKNKKKRKHTEDSNVPTQTDSSNNYLDIDSEIKGVKRKHDEVNPLEAVKEPKKKHKKKKRSRQDQVIDSKELEVENKEKIEKEEKVKQKYDIRNNTKTESPPEMNANRNNKGGQWQTADFGDTERQNKFMKLLGGQKPGADKTHLQAKFKLNAGVNNKNMRPNNSEATAPMPNMAMNKTQERMYKIALENQFVKAQDFNQNRGVGLGFQADNKGSKKFHIDVFKSKSVKFDD